MNGLPLLVRRGLAVALLFVFLTAIWSLALHPLYRATDTALDELYNARFELRRIALAAEDAKSTTPEAVTAARESLAAELFTTHVSSEGDVRFLSVVDQLARSAGIHLLQLKAGAPAHAGMVTRFSAEVSATASEAQLSQLLVAIEQHHPILVIDRLALASQGGAPSAGNLDTPPELTIELRLFGFGADLGPPTSQGDENAR